MLLYARINCCIPSTKIKINCWEPESCVSFIICILPRSGFVTKATISPHKKGPLTYTLLLLLYSSSSPPQPHSPQKRGRNIASKHTSSSSHFRLSLSRSEKKGGRRHKKAGLTSSLLRPPQQQKAASGGGKKANPTQATACPPAILPTTSCSVSFAAASVLLSLSWYMSHGLGSLSPLCPRRKATYPSFHPSFPSSPSPGMTASGSRKSAQIRFLAKDFASKQPKSLQKYCRFSIQN